MHVLTWTAFAVVAVGVLCVFGGLRRLPRLMQVGALLCAAGIALGSVYDARREHWGTFAIDLALVAANIVYLFLLRRDQRREAAEK